MDVPKKKVTYTVVGGLLIAALLIGFGVARRGRADAVLQRSFERLLAAESYRTHAALALHLPATLRGRERAFTEITVTLDGDINYTDEGVPEFSGTLYGEAKGRGNIFFVDGDIRVLTDDTRFYLDDIPVLLNPSGSLTKKWTVVPGSLLKTNNNLAVREALAGIVTKLSYQGKEDVDEVQLYRYTGTVSPEDEDRLIEVVRQGVSGNKGLHVLARLLRANNVKTLDVWVNPDTSEISRIQVNFVRPLNNGSEFDFATLTLSFQDYGSSVVIDRPEGQITVRPDIFSRLFGSGDFEAIHN